MEEITLQARRDMETLAFALIDILDDGYVLEWIFAPDRINDVEEARVALMATIPASEPTKEK